MSITCDEPMPMTQDMPVAPQDSPTIFSSSFYRDQDGQIKLYQWCQPDFEQGNRLLYEWPSKSWTAEKIRWGWRPKKGCVLGMFDEQHWPEAKYLDLYKSHKQQAMDMQAFFESVQGANPLFESMRWQFLVILAHYVQFMDILMQCLQDPGHHLTKSRQTEENEHLIPYDQYWYKAIWTSLTEPVPLVHTASSGTVIFTLEGTARALKLKLEHPRRQFHTIHVNLQHDFFNVAIYQNGHVLSIREAPPAHAFFAYKLVAEDGTWKEQRVYMTQKDDFDRCMDIFLDMDLDGPLLSLPVTFKPKNTSARLYKSSRFPTACSPPVQAVLVLEHLELYAHNDKHT